MNERFQKLAEQAEKYADANFKGEPFWTQAYESKFAELIVAECLEACSRANEIKHFVPPTQEQVVLSCMREIETTFRS